MLMVPFSRILYYVDLEVINCAFWHWQILYSLFVVVLDIKTKEPMAPIKEVVGYFYVKCLPLNLFLVTCNVNVTDIKNYCQL